MRFEYVVTLKRENERHIDFISFTLCFLSILASLFEQIRTRHFNFFFSLAAAIIAAGLAINLTASKKGARTRYRNWLLVAGLLWIGMPYLQWIAIIFILLAFLESQAKYPLEIGFSKELIVVNSLFKKKFSWSDFNNVMLKDGLLTLDFRDNRLFQKEALEDEEDDADEDEFNQFCSERLKQVMR
ncbi:MAG TPA: hypothetical protein VFV08_15260 [Puia sp.]|nr:hypothetical protein [Puia sp.]